MAAKHTDATNLPHFVGIDIGTTTVRCVVGALNQVGEPEIIGYGSAVNQGMRKGVITHVEEVANAIIAAINEAERHSGRRVHSATVNINGSHVSGVNSKGVIAISAANREITNEDRYRVEEAAAVMQLPANREIIQVFPKSYSLDGQENIKDPVGMHGVRLEVDTHIVTASTPSVKSLDNALEKAQVVAKHRTVSSLAAAEAVLNRQQKEAGTVVIDIGAGTTNVVIIEDGEVQHVAIVPMGGTHITNDLAIGLKTDLDIAEKVKLDHAQLGSRGHKAVAAVTVGKTQHTFNADDVRMIIEARVEEIFEYVDKELIKIKRSRKLPGGAVIVGATAKLPGLADFAKEQLQLPARVGQLLPIGGLSDINEDSSYVSAIGLMLLDMILDASGQGNPYDSESISLIKSISGLLNKFKRN
jgi:cell division protein FtsA